MSSDAETWVEEPGATAPVVFLNPVSLGNLVEAESSLEVRLEVNSFIHKALGTTIGAVKIWVTKINRMVADALYAEDWDILLRIVVIVDPTKRCPMEENVSKSR